MSGSAHEIRLTFPDGGDPRAIVMDVLDLRDELVAWARSPRNQYELVARTDDEHAGHLYLATRGWVLKLTIRYRTAAGDGDGHDIKRAIMRKCDRSPLAYKIDHVKLKPEPAA